MGTNQGMVLSTDWRVEVGKGQEGSFCPRAVFQHFYLPKP